MRYILCLLLLFVLNTGYSQYSEWINTDRPCQTSSPSSIGKKVLQFQTGYTNGDFSGTVLERVTNAFDVKVRYGVLERMDVNVLFNGGWYRIQEKATQERYTESRPDNMSFNLRYHIYEGNGWIPAIGAEAGALLVYDNDDGFNETNFRGILMLGWSITDQASFSSNLITNNSENFEFTLNFGYAFTDRIGGVLEWWQTYNSGNNTGGYLNFGAYYNVSKNFQLDFATLWLRDEGDIPNSLNVSDLQLQIGFTGRLDWRD